MNLVRLDTDVDQHGHWKAIWALRVPDAKRSCDEFLVCLYDLIQVAPDAPLVRHRNDVTHELIIVGLSPKVRVKFEENVFTQKLLEPLLPPNYGFQFKADGDEAAQARVQVCVNSILNGTISPEADTYDTWVGLFGDGVNLVERAPST